jgi:hypothetical protein
MDWWYDVLGYATLVEIHSKSINTPAAFNGL